MRILGKTNLKVNEIGCGGIPIQRVSQEVVNDMINEMVKQNINFIDTARGYSISEELLGNALVGKRDKFILATKSMSRTYEGMKKDIEISLNNLKTNYIDIYQIHNVSLKDDYKGAYEALVEAKEKGLIGHIGVTSHSLEFMENIIKTDMFETIQFPYNIVETQAEEVFKKAKDNNIGIIVMKPLAGGAITNAKVAIKYILNNENISVVIPGMESVDQVKENNKIKEGQYTDLEIKNIKEVKQLLDNDFCRRCGYCLPCTKGINIPFVFLCEGYVTRYNLGEWGLSRYQTLPAKASDCISCKVCESRCPYKLKISEKMKKVVKIMENKDEK